MCMECGRSRWLGRSMVHQALAENIIGLSDPTVSGRAESVTGVVKWIANQRKFEVTQQSFTFLEFYVDSMSTLCRFYVVTWDVQKVRRFAKTLEPCREVRTRSTEPGPPGRCQGKPGLGAALLDGGWKSPWKIPGSGSGNRLQPLTGPETGKKSRRSRWCFRRCHHLLGEVPLEGTHLPRWWGHLGLRGRVGMAGNPGKPKNWWQHIEYGWYMLVHLISFDDWNILKSIGTS